jgi:hypothetical protein
LPGRKIERDCDDHTQTRARDPQLGLWIEIERDHCQIPAEIAPQNELLRRQTGEVREHRCGES